MYIENKIFLFILWLDQSVFCLLLKFLRSFQHIFCVYIMKEQMANGYILLFRIHKNIQYPKSWSKSVQNMFNRIYLLLYLVYICILCLNQYHFRHMQLYNL